MRQAQAVLRRLGWSVLAGWAAVSTGCIHHHYYGQGGVPVVEATPGAVSSQYGAVCEVPQGGAVIAQTPGRITTLGSPSRVVINSQPIGGQAFGRRSARNAWQPQGVATRVEGGLDDEAITR